MQAAVAKNMMPSLSVPVSRIAMSICTDEFDKLYATLKPKGVTMTALLTKAVGVAPPSTRSCTPPTTTVKVSCTTIRPTLPSPSRSMTV